MNVPVSIVRDASIGGWLQMIAGLAVLKAIRGACPHRSAEPQLKWPNDIVVGGRKLGAFSPKWCRFLIAANVWRSCSALA